MNASIPGASVKTSDKEPGSADEARRRAEFHRAQIADTLDALSNRINDTVQTAHDRINKPLNLIRQHPLTAIGVSLAVGFAIAAATNVKKRRSTQRSQGVAQAYYDGRRDEYDHRPPRQLPIGNPHEGRPFGFTVRSTLLDLALPLIRTISGNMAETLIARKFRR